MHQPKNQPKIQPKNKHIIRIHDVQAITPNKDTKFRRAKPKPKNLSCTTDNKSIASGSEAETFGSGNSDYTESLSLKNYEIPLRLLENKVIELVNEQTRLNSCIDILLGGQFKIQIE